MSHRRPAGGGARWPALLARVALVGALGGGCASQDSVPTSVFLEIVDATPVASETDVDLDVYASSDGGAAASKLASLHRTAAAQSSASSSSVLGSVVILAGADGGSAALRISILGRRSSASVVLSQGRVDVVLVAQRQIGARLNLAREGQGDGGAGDAGGGDAGAGGDLPPPRDAGGSGDTTAPADGAGPADTGADRGSLLRNGDSCTAAGMCSSGFCVDGVCCNNDCSPLCRACNLSGSRGTCTLFAAGSQCAAATCDSSDRLIPARTCDSSGNCGAATPVSCGNYRCQSGDCPRSCTSDNVCISSANCTFNRCL